MRKGIKLLIAMTMALSLVACGSKNEMIIQEKAKVLQQQRRQQRQKQQQILVLQVVA